MKPQNTKLYIALFPMWEEQLNDLKNVIDGFPLEEAIKWGAPCYMLNGKNVVGLTAFKNHCAAWFYKGAMIPGSEVILHNAQPGKTQMLRQLRFRESEKVNIPLFKNLVEQAIAVEIEQSR